MNPFCYCGEVNAGEALMDAAIGAFGAKVGGSAGNTSHLNTMGKNLFSRIGKALNGKVFTSQADLKAAGREIMAAFKYYASQATTDNVKVAASVLKSSFPWLVDLGYDVYAVKAGK